MYTGLCAALSFFPIRKLEGTEVGQTYFMVGQRGLVNSFILETDTFLWKISWNISKWTFSSLPAKAMNGSYLPLWCDKYWGLWS
jgi:hypothetical protein